MLLQIITENIYINSKLHCNVSNHILILVHQKLIFPLFVSFRINLQKYIFLNTCFP